MVHERGIGQILDTLLLANQLGLRPVAFLDIPIAVWTLVLDLPDACEP